MPEETPKPSQSADLKTPSSLEELLADGSSLSVALAGNPNSGKTTVFNSLTGSRQRVGNYAGVTVEEIQGIARHSHEQLLVTDLPGTYSLTARSEEEVVTRNFLLDQEPGVVVDIVDASNLERNLYLAVQLLELGVPLVLALNMSDVAEARGCRIDAEKLSTLLGVPIVLTVGHKAQGLEDLMEQALATARFSDQALAQQKRCSYGEDIEHHLSLLAKAMKDHVPAEHLRWYCIKLLEADPETARRLRKFCPEKAEEFLDRAEKSRARLEQHLGDRAEILLAERRYGFISGACAEAVRRSEHARHDLSDRVDVILTHPILGLPIFAVLMYLTFQLTFTLGEPPMGWLESGFEWLALHTAQLWPRGSDNLLKSLLVDGIIGGVGGVVAFLPNILLLFFAIALLEGTGYMARAAFIMDSLMHRIGLHGKSFIPMMIGFGCSVPAILATRTLENRRDRLTTMLIVPLMSCGARIPIYALFIPAFFPVQWRGPMLWLIYFIGIAVAVVCAKLLRSTLLRGETTPFVMELPPYRMPTFSSLVVHMWERAWMYVKKAGTLILGVSIILWALTAFPRQNRPDVQAEANILQAQAQAMEKLDTLSERMDMADRTELIARGARARLDRQQKLQQYWPDETGFDQVGREYREELERISREPGGRGVAEMFRLADRIEPLGQEEQLPLASLGAAAEQDGQEDSPPPGELERLRSEDPEAFQAAVVYLRDFSLPLEAKRQSIHAQAASEKLQRSYLGRIGKGMEPILAWMGFDWRVGTALVGAVAAKEVFVSQMGIVFAAGEDSEEADTLREDLRTHYSPLVGFCIMLFCLVSAPCVGTAAATWRESGSWKWAALQWFGLTALAFVLTTITYQVGSLLF